MKTRLILLSAIVLAASCKSNNAGKENGQTAVNNDRNITQPDANLAPQVANIPLLEDQNRVTITPVVEGLNIPWGMAWLPNGDLIYTEKEGTMFRYDGAKSHAIKNLPAVYTRGQGGLLDVTTHPNFKENNLIYISYASPEGDDAGGNTAVARAILKNDALLDFKVLYKASPNTKQGVHFGSRFAWDSNGYLYFSTGDRGNRDENPQDLTRDNGKIYRIKDDGIIPDDNPFVNIAGAKKAVYTYGNRNVQGLTTHPKTGEIIAHEHGPQGGDEINFIKPGLNYGWPIISYGEEYGGGVFAESTRKDGMAQPFYYWVPSIAPSGFAIINNKAYGDWNGNFLVGSLKFQYLEMLYVNEKGVIKREKVADKIGRLRDVKISPEGIIYIAVESKGIFKLSPK